MALVAQNTSPADLLSRFRGQIFSSRPGYPEVLHLKLRDGAGGEWWLSTFYAEYSPSDPEIFLDKTVVTAEMEPSGGLTVGFSDGSRLDVRPIPLEPNESGDDLETWSLISPDGLIVDYGPGERSVLKTLGRPPGTRENDSRR
jgi:hypothetical protein